MWMHGTSKDFKKVKRLALVHISVFLKKNRKNYIC